MFEKIILSGLAATAVMTLFTNTAAVLLKKNLYVIRILAQLLGKKSVATNQQNPFSYWIVAVIVHYLIGVFFAFACLVWLPRVSGTHAQFSAWLKWGLILGLTAMVAWASFKRVREGYRAEVPWNLFYVLIFVGHILFSLVLHAVYFRLR